MNVIETTSSDTIESVIKCESNIGIIKFNKTEYAFCKNLMQLNNLNLDVFYTYSEEVITKKDNNISKKSVLRKEDLHDQIAIIFNEQEITESILTKGNFFFGDKVIKVNDRATKFSLLTTIKDSYMFSSKLPEAFLIDQNLVSIPYENEYNTWYDAIIYKKSHVLTDVEKELVTYIKNKAALK